jgi:hypothetical protein
MLSHSFLYVTLSRPERTSTGSAPRLRGAVQSSGVEGRVEGRWQEVLRHVLRRASVPHELITTPSLVLYF